MNIQRPSHLPQPQAPLVKLTLEPNKDNQSTACLCGPAGKRQQVLALALIAAINLCSSTQFMSLYGSWVKCLGLGLGASCAGIAAACCGRLRGWFGLLSPTLALAAQFLLGPSLALSGPRRWSFLPSRSLLAQGLRATASSWKLFIHSDLPITEPADAWIALWTVILWSSFLSAWLYSAAQQAAQQTQLLLLSGSLPLGTLILSCLFTPTQNWYWAVLGAITSAVLLLWTSWVTGLRAPKQALPRLMSISLAGTLAFGTTALLPLQRVSLRDFYEPPLSLTAVSSPLSDYRAYYKHWLKEELFQAQGLPADTPVRLAVMDCFDGQVWGFSPSPEPRKQESYRRLSYDGALSQDSNHTLPTSGSRLANVRFSLSPQMEGRWLPSIGQALTYSNFHGMTSEHIYYSQAQAAALTNQDLAGPVSYHERARLLSAPSRQAIAGSQAQSIQQAALTGAPAGLEEAAIHYAGQGLGLTDGQKALNIADRLRQEGWFSHGLAGSYPSLPGHGSYRIASMLKAQPMVGDSEQYASLMALLARQSGLPSRLVLGFLPQAPQGSIDSERTPPASQQAHSSFRGKDAQAWVEINFTDLGWVAFYPTPPASRQPQPQAQPEPETTKLLRPPSTELVQPLVEPEASDLSSAGADSAGSNPNPPSFWERRGPLIKRIGVLSLPLWLTGSLLAALMLLQRRRLYRYKHLGDPRARIERGWAYLAGVAGQHNHRALGTRSQQAQSIAQAYTQQLRRQLRRQEQRQDKAFTELCHQLSQEADQASFSSSPCSEAQALLYWQQIEQARAYLISASSRSRRWKLRISTSPIPSLVVRQRARPSASLSTSTSARPHPRQSSMQASRLAPFARSPSAKVRRL
ncbi:transglutaminase-like domain-containing protein [Bombiscardovia apis]|uniref:transglutaminase-like domain-containing protein n=1 Tax=Bombiscardovia apis TaxID=2932182 RepID=UPI002953CA1C|nr:transglutaminase-like domain-containing protein [Bombiscardovia apis]